MKIQKPTIYYDGSCPLCSTEIAHYERCAGSENIQWHDISSKDSEHLVPDLSREEAMKRLHLRKGDGQLVSGAEAFVNMWLQLDRYRWLGNIVRHQPLLWIAERSYRLFLKLRPAFQQLAAMFLDRGKSRTAK